jgi:hypothetical protein
MIRECFRTKTGIIFDEHMLKYDIGLDIDNILDHKCPAPPRAKPDGVFLQTRKGCDIQLSFGYKLLLLFALPFNVLWSHLKKLRLGPNLNEVKLDSDSEPTSFEGEAVEEMKDAVSPIFDQMSQSLFWHIMEYIPFLLRKPSADYGPENSKSGWAYRWM